MLILMLITFAAGCHAIDAGFSDITLFAAFRHYDAFILLLMPPL